jgi:uncharacterized protein (TIGR03437 family)
LMKWFLIILASAAPLAAQTQQPCTFAVTPTAITVPNLGGSGTISVNTQTGCAWAFSTGSTWIALSSPNAVSGQINGSGLLNYTASASSLPTSQQGSISINGTGISIPVTQGAAVCSMTLQPASNTIGAAGGPSSFGVQTSCSWTATSSTPWISVSSPSTTSPSGMVANVTGAGNGTVPFTAAPNGCVSPQTGTISVTSQPAQIFTLTESDVGWLSISTAANGTGNGGIGYTISANTGPPRAGNIHVGSQLFAVAQAGVALPTVQLNAVVSGANNAPGNAGAAVAPGEIVTLYGTNMGPSPAVPLQLANGGTSITNILGGVQVLFDGNAAPLTYVSALQINAIAPVGLAGKTSTQVTVTYQGFTSNAVTVPVQATAPGIFAADGTGGGGGAILNQDYSLNVRLNPAARGSVIMIYLTGAGVTAPASVDGAITGITPPFPSLPQSVAVGVTIGGIAVPAQNILYAGAAPEQIEGLTQIDVLIPASVTPGPTVPIVVTIGGVSSQSGLTVSVN